VDLALKLAGLIGMASGFPMTATCPALRRLAVDHGDFARQEFFSKVVPSDKNDIILIQDRPHAAPLSHAASPKMSPIFQEKRQP